MFTGIVAKSAQVTAFDPKGSEGVEVRIATGFGDLEIGESISVNGVCLTATEFDSAGEAHFFLGSETLRRTNLGKLTVGTTVNLERAMLASTRLSGHWVQGHVDGSARVAEIGEEGETFRLRFGIAKDLAKYCVEKGSITLNGVSLTLNSVADAGAESVVTVHLIPHTWNHTNLSELRVGDSVNVEVDILAKYVERLCQPYLAR
jgi:riboflavin synthase